MKCRVGGDGVEAGGCVVPPERLDEVSRGGEYLAGGGHGAAFLAARADSSS
jgi:hypothetical protein